MTDAINNRDLNTVINLHQNNFRFTMWNLHDALLKRFTPIVKYIVENMEIPIQNEILQLAQRLNYEDDVLNLIQNKM